MKRIAVLLLVLSVVLTRSPAAWADAAEDAAALKATADELFDQGRYAEANDLYKRAYATSADPALLYNQARALESMGDYPEALDQLEAFSREAPPDVRAKVPRLEELTADLRARTATIHVTTNVPMARLYVRGKDSGTIEREATVRARAGNAVVRVEADGYEPFARDLALPGGGSVDVNAELERARARGTTPHESRSLTSRWWFWTALGVLAAGGVTVGVIALTSEKAPERGSFDPTPIRVKGFAF
ncbi:MAG: tetratricopeptide repeat protein [Labilithrix sp.]|nr:tetratricopeptide repeat protein [Labilithrix sp.]MBX3221633.1 tetratricopeptide repeat protein [Labilithrix sp.]